MPGAFHATALGIVNCDARRATKVRRSTRGHFWGHHATMESDKRRKCFVSRHNSIAATPISNGSTILRWPFFFKGNPGASRSCPGGAGALLGGQVLQQGCAVARRACMFLRPAGVEVVALRIHIRPINETKPHDSSTQVFSPVRCVERFSAAVRSLSWLRQAA